MPGAVGTRRIALGAAGRRTRVAARAIAHPDARWDPLMCCVVAYILVAVGRIHQLFPVLEVLHPAALTAMCSAALLALDRRRARRVWPTTRQPTVRFLIAVAAWGVLSAPLALWVGGAAAVVFDRMIKATVMVVVVVSAVRGVRDAERLLFAVFAGTATYAVVVMTRFDVSATADGRLAQLYYYDANDFSLLCAVSLALGVFAVWRGRTVVGRLLSLAGLGAIVVTFVWTGSRGGFLTVAVVALFSAVRLTGIPARWRVGGVAVLAITIGLAASESYWKRMDTIVDSDEDYNRTSASGRIQVWKRGIGYMMQHPILGVGPGNFPTAEGRLSPLAWMQERNMGVKWSAAHNSYVQMGAELGVPGLLLFLGSIAASFLALRRAERSPPVRDLAQASTAALVAFACGAMFLSLAYSDLIYALHAIAISAAKVATPGAGRNARA